MCYVWLLIFEPMNVIILKKNYELQQKIINAFVYMNRVAAMLFRISILLERLIHNYERIKEQEVKGCLELSH